MLYIPSPISVPYDVMYEAVANVSGRMQYYKAEVGSNRIRIGRGDFIDAFNNANIIAIKPIQENTGHNLFQLRFFAKNS